MIQSQSQSPRSSRIRGPFTRWPRVADACLAGVVFLAAVLVTNVPDDRLTLRLPSEVPRGDYLLVGMAAGALYWRRSRPLVVLGIIVVASISALAFGLSDISGIAVIAVYVVGRYVEDDVRASIGGAAGAGLIVVTGLVSGVPADEIWAGLFAALLAFFIGTRIRLWRLRSRQMERDRISQMREAVAEERTRIARELHDVVAHHVSLMTVQAGAARTVADDDPEAAARAMAAVESAGREVLVELRDLLDVLRPETPTDELGPQPRLTAVSRLVDRLNATGMDIELSMEGSEAELPARVDLFSYRIVQEALTNVLKHAGSDARTKVTVLVNDQTVEIDVTDDGQGSAPSAEAGHGLIGMKERAPLLGGTLVVRPGPGGGFSVVAKLPIQQVMT